MLLENFRALLMRKCRDPIRAQSVYSLRARHGAQTSINMANQLLRSC